MRESALGLVLMAYFAKFGHWPLTSALWGDGEPWQRLVKMLPHMSDELAIRGMIGRLNANDSWIKRGHVLLHVP
jgi:hypothetical protein